VNTTTGIGGAVAACFDAWRASEDDFAAFCDAYVELGACSAEWWAGDDVAALNPNVAWDTVSWTATAGEGQPWDVNLAQMARAVNAMHHLGYSLSPEDRLRIFVRVYCWRAAMCGMVQMLSLFDPPQGGVNTYGWTNHAPPDGTGAPSSELCADGTAFKGRAPGAPEVLEGVMAIVRGGLDIPWALGPSPFLESFRDAIVGDIALSSLRTVAALYRVGLETPFPDTPGHFWLSVDTGNGYPWTVGASDAPTGDSGQSWWRQPEATFKRRALGGTYTAIISLMLSDRASLFPGCAATSSLTGYPGRAPQTGLDSFYSLFGSSAVHSSPPSWGAGYVPG
jgi:hypothetical protein